MGVALITGCSGGIGLESALAGEDGPHGIRVVSIAPGLIVERRSRRGLRGDRGRSSGSGDPVAPWVGDDAAMYLDLRTRADGGEGRMDAAPSIVEGTVGARPEVE